MVHWLRHAKIQGKKAATNSRQLAAYRAYGPRIPQGLRARLQGAGRQWPQRKRITSATPLLDPDTLCSCSDHLTSRLSESVEGLENVRRSKIAKHYAKGVQYRQPNAACEEAGTLALCFVSARGKEQGNLRKGNCLIGGRFRQADVLQSSLQIPYQASAWKQPTCEICLAKVAPPRCRSAEQPTRCGGAGNIFNNELQQHRWKPWLADTADPPNRVRIM